MIEIISGTNRPGSRTRQICTLVHNEFKKINVEAQILDLVELPVAQMPGTVYFKDQPSDLKKFNDRIVQSQGLVVVVPEYNGSFPGVLKYFIDHWPFPTAFHFRPVWLIGLGGRFGGLRAIEHLSQVFAYRQAHIFPFNLILTNITETLKEGLLNDKFAADMLKKNAAQFSNYSKHLRELPLVP